MSEVIVRKNGLFGELHKGNTAIMDFSIRRCCKKRSDDDSCRNCTVPIIQTLYGVRVTVGDGSILPAISEGIEGMRIPEERIIILNSDEAFEDIGVKDNYGNYIVEPNDRLCFFTSLTVIETNDALLNK